jgi:methylmalonyl-CoA mutase cobalamin-binding domain/chain
MKSASPAVHPVQWPILWRGALPPLDRRALELIAHNISVLGHMWAFRRWSLARRYTIDEYIRVPNRFYPQPLPASRRERARCGVRVANVRNPTIPKNFNPGRQEQIMAAETELYKPRNPIRVVTATSLFDGHDAAINIYRRLLQANGVEVIHLGHNRSVKEIVDAAVEEDVQGVAVSSYQGGHMEFFKYLVDLLRESGAPHVKVFGGGGGVIVPAEIKELEAYGVAKIYTPEDGTRLGLQGIVAHMAGILDFSRVNGQPARSGSPVRRPTSRCWPT